MFNSSQPDQLTTVQQETTTVLGQQTALLFETIAPYLAIRQNNVVNYMDSNSIHIVENMRFFRLVSCTTEKIDNLSLFLSNKMSKLFTAIYSFNVPVAYGVISYNGQTSLVLGITRKESQNILEKYINGSLTGIEIEPYIPDFFNRRTSAISGGVVSAVPVMEIGAERQQFDISTLMRILAGSNYTVLCIAEPYDSETIQSKYSTLLQIWDEFYRFSKINFSEQDSNTITKSKDTGHSSSFSFGAVIDSCIGPVKISNNTEMSFSEAISNNISKAFGKSTSITYDMQNGFALKMMEYCDCAIKRFGRARNVGLWGTALTYSADSQMAGSIIQTCLSGELSKPATAIPPLRKFSYSMQGNEQFYIPLLGTNNPLLAPITSSELGMLCTPPSEPVPDFELKSGKLYPMVRSSNDGVVIGKVFDGNRSLENLNFSLSEADLNKHTFICGITGSGKTTIAKSILHSCNKPFIVMECAKKEYRNLRLSKENASLKIYTLGKPELTCLQFNPFYIQCGVSLQTHIDYLRDLFNAYFSFCSPMSHILEMCLQNIYRKKGWSLTLGYHPRLINTTDKTRMFDAGYIREQYDLKAHRYLFPTMSDLRQEVAHYIETEVQNKDEPTDNTKTAILARLDNLCTGSKGFMLNTVEPLSINQLMQDKVVFELDGLANDADKSFFAGLLVVYINEYRQIYKDEHLNEYSGLQHLLIIEDAHRLFRNIGAELTSENMGSPKLKAVEHFTNVIAEMRSYGQGVIVVEQIPSKLASDVIKNSSNKIIQRVVSADDQALIANTIGLKETDAIYLGNIKTGYALCHKEGMNLPALVQINYVPDNLISDGDLLAAKGDATFEEVNLYLIKGSLIYDIEKYSLRLLNTLLGQNNEQIIESIAHCKDRLNVELRKKDVSLFFCKDLDALYSKVIAGGIANLLVCGVYSLSRIMSDDFYTTIEELLLNGKYKDIVKIKNLFRNGYMEEPRKVCIRIVSALIKYQYKDDIDLKKSIQQYFILIDDNLVSDIEMSVKKEVCNASRNC